MWENRNYYNGLSVLPYADHTYKQAPYQDCNVEEYEELLEKLPKDIDWTLLKNYEQEDNTAGSQTMACSGDSCEVVDLS